MIRFRSPGIAAIRNFTLNTCCNLRDLSCPVLASDLCLSVCLCVSHKPFCAELSGNSSIAGNDGTSLGNFFCQTLDLDEFRKGLSVFSGAAFLLQRELWRDRSSRRMLLSTRPRPSLCLAHSASNFVYNAMSTMQRVARGFLRQLRLVTSAEEGGYVFSSVCLSVCPSDYSQTCERILTKFYGGVGHGSRTK